MFFRSVNADLHSTVVGDGTNRKRIWSPSWFCPKTNGKRSGRIFWICRQQLREWCKFFLNIFSIFFGPNLYSIFSNGESGPNSNEQIYESLELIHIYVLANILKRPIIVVSDSILRSANGDPLSPIPFGGIYLPLELNPQQCHRFAFFRLRFICFV
jgi:OTU domain-containing protein 7